MPTLGRFIRRRRLELGMTQEQLAHQLGQTIRQAEISRLENDRTHLPRRDRLERLAEVLQVPIGELLARSGWAGADTALEAIEYQAPPPAPSAAIVSVRALLDEVKGLVDDVEGILRTNAAQDE